MVNQITPSVTNPTVADIYERIADGKLDLAPDFQRKFVWTHEHQEQFLDTILHGYPFPEIYVCQGETDLKKMKTHQKVIDGQQRLTTIRNYIEDSFDYPLKLVPAFKQLEDDEKGDFLAYQIVVRDIGKVDDDLVKEVFRRINLTKFKLEDVEIHNAVYDGKFIQVAKSLAEEVDLDQYGVFHDSEFTRMVDVYFFLQVMATIERGGYFNRDVELEKCIAEFNDDYPNANRTKAKILEAISVIDDLNLDLDSIWFRKSNFFTLMIELCMTKKIPEEIAERLLEFEQQVMKARNSDTKFGQYYGYMYAGTTGRKARVTRSEMFRKHVLS